MDNLRLFQRHKHVDRYRQHARARLRNCIGDKYVVLEASVHRIAKACVCARASFSLYTAPKLNKNLSASVLPAAISLLSRTGT